MLTDRQILAHPQRFNGTFRGSAGTVFVTAAWVHEEAIDTVGHMPARILKWVEGVIVWAPAMPRHDIGCRFPLRYTCLGRELEIDVVLESAVFNVDNWSWSGRVRSVGAPRPAAREPVAVIDVVREELSLRELVTIAGGDGAELAKARFTAEGGFELVGE